MRDRLQGHILLFGLRGSGKSIVARLVAERISRPMVDLDVQTLNELGARSIAEAFAERGESGWREAEACVLDRMLSSAEPLIIALGGGSPLAPGADVRLRRARESESAELVLLDATPELLLARRRADDADRPTLRDGESLEAEISRTAQQRLPGYRRLATVVIEVCDPAEEPERTAERLLERLSNEG